MSLRTESVARRTNMTPEAAQKVQDRRKPSKEPEWIGDVGVLVQLARGVLDSAQLTPQEREETEGYRDVIRDCRFRSDNLVPKSVDARIWTFMVNGAINGMINDLRVQQNNTGDWRLREYELEQTTLGGERFIEIFAKFTDVLNLPAVQYQHGKPVVNVTVQAPGIPPELIAALQAKVSESSGGGLADTFKAILENQNKLLARAMDERASKTMALEASKPKKVDGRTNRWAKRKEAEAAKKAPAVVG